jgi:hypothetical protein
MPDLSDVKEEVMVMEQELANSAEFEEPPGSVF